MELEEQFSWTMTSQLLEVETCFENMERVGKVDLGALKLLSTVYENIISTQKSILKMAVDNQSKFVLFHSTDLQIKFLEKLIGRLKIAERAQDNPQVAKDTLDVYPFFCQIHSETNSLIDSFNEDSLDNLDRSLPFFQQMSTEKKLFPSSESIFNGVNKKMLKNEVRFIHSSIGEYIHGD